MTFSLWEELNEFWDLLIQGSAHCFYCCALSWINPVHSPRKQGQPGKPSLIRAVTLETVWTFSMQPQCKTSSSARIKALLLICAPFLHTHDHCVWNPVFPEKISSCSRRQCSPTQAVVFVIPPSFPSLQSLKQDPWQSAPCVCVWILVFERTGGGACQSLPTCPPVNWSLLTDFDRGWTQTWEPGETQGRVKRTNVRFGCGLPGCSYGNSFL